MSQPQQSPAPDAEIATLVAWLRERELTFPAWLLLETMRPFGWLAAQALLVAEPLARGLGLHGGVTRAQQWLEEPGTLESISVALAPERERGEPWS